MPDSLFTITPTPPTSITLAPGENGTFSFTITCQAAPDRSFDVILQALLVGADGKAGEAAWLGVGPPSTLSMTGGETATVVITARPTAKAPLGRNNLKLALADKDRPNDTYTYSAPVVCEIKPRDGASPPTTKKFPLWLIAVIAGVVVLAGGGVLIWKLTSGGGDTPVVDAAVPPSDAPLDVRTVHVTTTGDDAKDGVTGPVKTLKRAIAIANGNGAITAIALAAGKYGAANGESFPYAVPANVTLAGDPAGGTILAGTTAGEGLTLDTGKLQDLELQDFGVAIKATGTAALSNIKVRTSAVAVAVETAGKLTVAKLDLAGTAAACSNIGMQVRGSGQLTVTGLTAQAVGTVLRQVDNSSVSITTGNLAGDAACATPLLTVNAASFTLADVTIDGGDSGISFSGTTTATLTNTTIANVKGDAIVGRLKTAQITGGELRNNGRAGMEVSGGAWTLTNVGIKGNPVMGIYLQGGGGDAPGTLVMRGSTVTGNGTGIYLFDFAIGDLGTAANPGNNTIQNNVNIGLAIDGNSGARTIDGAGNTWTPNTQGANAQGKYSPALKTAVPRADRNNFSINPGWRLQL